MQKMSAAPGAAELRIRPAEERDLEKILAIYAHARDFMRETGNPRQWNTVWPPAALAAEDILRRRSFVCVRNGDEVCGVFVYLQGEDCEPTYAKIDGAWKQGGVYGVVHRIAVSENGRGIGRACLDWAFAQCGHIRIDTHPDNRVMQRVLEKSGYEKRGIIHVLEDNDPRLAYEKF